MANVLFFEKPGCAGNARQKALLRASGHEVEARSLLSEPWSQESLRPYFGEKPVRDWFNLASPRVKSAEVAIDSLSEEQAIALMLADPLLIRRPLMQLAGRCESGFDAELVDAWIGLAATPEKISDACVREPPRANATPEPLPRAQKR
jgi:nitrogenase-associated protein